MTNTQLCYKISDKLKIDVKQVVSTVTLLDEGGTIPFIARYRKEVNLRTIEGQGKLTEELKEKILDAETLSKLEDLYLPYKPKRRTKATIAREKGLEPLAQFILTQANSSLDDE